MYMHNERSGQIKSGKVELNAPGNLQPGSLIMYISNLLYADILVNASGWVLMKLYYGKSE
jgi:hypothetical protein